jgi:hypothetical protein
MGTFNLYWDEVQKDKEKMDVSWIVIRCFSLSDTLVSLKVQEKGKGTTHNSLSEY